MKGTFQDQRREISFTTRCLGDFELRIYFNPAEIRVEKDKIEAIMTRLSLNTGLSAANLDHLSAGEIILRFNPLTQTNYDMELAVKKLQNYIESISPVTL